MRIIKTHEVEVDALPSWDRDQVYNGLDVCVTHEVFQKTSQQLDNITGATYAFSRALQGPVLEMQWRGVLVDQARKEDVIEGYLRLMFQLEKNLQRIALDGVGMAKFDWTSWQDQQRLFYDHLGLPPIRKQGRLTTDRAAREELEFYESAVQLVKHINLLADLGKKVSVLRTEIDPDGRMHTSYNIAGTNTGRFSSSMSEFGTGTNLQNIEESLRSIFISDPGMKFAKCDAKSGESFCVGAKEWNLFHDGRYLDACESGDPHTAVARIIWPGLGWTGDVGQDKHIAERDYYRHYSYRFMCKKLGHGSNYGGKPETLSHQSRLPIQVVEEFQPRYFAAFPAHQQWQEWVYQQLTQVGYLISLLGRKRWFFKRRDAHDTLREAIAYDPQSSLADIVNNAMLKLWRMGHTIVMHDHDALTFMYPEAQEDDIIPILMRELIVPVPLDHNRELRIPYDCAVGWNKGKYDSETNPNGLIEYFGHDNRHRIPEIDLLDRIVHRADRGARRA